METKKCQNPTPKILGYKEYRSEKWHFGTSKTRFPGTQKPEKWHFGPQKPEKPTFDPFWRSGCPKTEFIDSQYCKKGTPRTVKVTFEVFGPQNRPFWTLFDTFRGPPPTNDKKRHPPKGPKNTPSPKSGIWGVWILGRDKTRTWEVDIVQLTLVVCRAREKNNL